VDLGRGRQRLQKVWPATEPGGHLVERPGPSRPARERWPAVARGHRGGHTGGAGGLWGAPARSRRAGRALPRPADLVAGHAGSHLGGPATAVSAAAPTAGGG